MKASRTVYPSENLSSVGDASVKSLSKIVILSAGMPPDGWEAPNTKSGWPAEAGYDPTSVRRSPSGGARSIVSRDVVYES